MLSRYLHFGVLENFASILFLSTTPNNIHWLSAHYEQSAKFQEERTAAVSTDIEGFAVFLYFFYYFLGTWFTISSETIDSNSVLFKSLKEPLQRVLLMKTNICIVVAILYADNQVANNRHARAIAKELLVCSLHHTSQSLWTEGWVDYRRQCGVKLLHDPKIFLQKEWVSQI